MMNVFFHLQFDIFISTLFGILEARFFKYAFQLSRDKILDLETHECLLYLANLPSIKN